MCLGAATASRRSPASPLPVTAPLSESPSPYAPLTRGSSTSPPPPPSAANSRDSQNWKDLHSFNSKIFNQQQQQIRVPICSRQSQSQCSPTMSHLGQFQFQFHYSQRSPSKPRSLLIQSKAEGNSSVDIDPSDCTNQSSNEKQLEVARPVGPSSSGKGLPYAPENCSSPGDVWTWKVGKRRSMSGHRLDRAVSPPRHLPTFTGSRSGFYSKVSLEQYIRKEFPDKDVDTFFAFLKWKIPALGGIVREAISEANGGSKSESASKVRDCKAGNKMCSLRTKARDCHALVAKSCDICCTEPGFCHDCCCVLCAKTVD